ncbi:hypothetical protein H0X09_00105 [Candidatus Saccharibacteria bacterium]|nr:hypothetical protein [Candidatus Saccharibacteria bacterium]
MKKKAILVLSAIVFVLVIYGLYSTAFIEVSVTGQGSSEISYKFINQDTSKEKVIKSGSTKLKTRVSKGNYEILVKQGEVSYVSIIKAAGFLKTSSISASLKPEKSRQFVGNNPGSCMNYNDSILVTHTCGTTYNKVNVHVPANSSLPTYIAQSSSLSIFGYLGGVVNTSEGSLALVRALGDDVSSYFIHRIDQSLKSLGSTALPNLDVNKFYVIKSYGSGFIIYDTSFQQVLIYPSRAAKPMTVKFDTPGEKNLILKDIDFRSNGFTKLYTTDDGSKDARSEVVAVREGKSKHYVFNKKFLQAKLCGERSLCVVTGERLEVYDIAQEKPKFSFALNGTELVGTSGKNILIKHGRGIINLDLDKRSGFIEFGLDDYDYCGIQEDAGTYLLCLINNKNKKVALRIDTGSDNTDSVDKKINQLLNTPEVSDVSIYGKFIFISPNLGELVYDSRTNGYGYNPATKKAANDKINQEIDRLGIDRRVYSITNTIP